MDTLRRTSDPVWTKHQTQSRETTCSHWFSRLDPLKKESKVGILKHNTMLITQLFLSLQSRPDADMPDFFKFENQREPPALSDRNSLRAGTKSDILKCIHAPTGHTIRATQATVQFVDMAAVIHMVPPTSALTFNEYVTFILCLS